MAGLPSTAYRLTESRVSSIHRSFDDALGSGDVEEQLASSGWHMNCVMGIADKGCTVELLEI